jgi:FkbM family methyltransferase
MEKSYAQRLEDYYLDRAFRDQAHGYYVDIGAGHPVEDNVSYWFYLRGWRGLVVEPQEALLATYSELRPGDVTDGSLIGRTAGETDFYVFPTLHGLSTMKPETADAAKNYDDACRIERRKVITLADLFARHRLGQIDFLKVDVEGAEMDVFAGADWTRWRPRVVLGEFVSPGAEADAWREWDDILKREDYECVLADDLNRYYVAREETELMKNFPHEVADWGVVAHW